MPSTIGPASPYIDLIKLVLDVTWIHAGRTFLNLWVSEWTAAMSAWRSESHGGE